MALLDKMSVADLVKVRKMNSSEASEFIQHFNLSSSELSQARKLFQLRDKHHDNRMWLSVGWLLGASFAQLARDKGVSKQSIMNSVDKLIPLEERKNGRMGGFLSLEAMAEYKVMFFENLETLTYLHPKEAASWILSHTSLDRDEHVG